MNRKHLYSIFHVKADVNLMVQNVIQNKNGVIISVTMVVKS